MLSWRMTGRYVSNLTRCDIHFVCSPYPEVRSAVANTDDPKMYEESSTYW